MNSSNTRGQILEAALSLFSTRGYEATSLADIAEAVGIRKPSIYSHFESKKDILDQLVRYIIRDYTKRPLFARFEALKRPFTYTKETFHPEELLQEIKGQFHMILHDPYISRGRKVGVLEQFHNPELAAILTQQSYTNIIQYYRPFFEYLLEKEIIHGTDAEILTYQFCLPITTWLSLCDREPERENELLQLAERHILSFFKEHME